MSSVLVLLQRVFLPLLAALALVNFAQLQTAHADDWGCRALQIQIDNSPRSQPAGRDSTQAKRYLKAISAQEAQIGKAKSQLRSTGCSGSIITLGSGGGANCSRLNGALKAMSANMTKLKAQYTRLSKGAGTVSSRDILKARYNNLGCNESGARGVTVVKGDNLKNSNTNDIGFLGKTKSKRDKRQGDNAKSNIPGLSFSGDTYRTLCVRKCDGYYFPISFSTTKENFKRDTVACESMCPGTAVELFMHKVPEEESEDMTTAKGEAYKAMSYAFAYRRDGVSSDPACRCQAIQGMAILNNSEATGISEVDSEPKPGNGRLDVANSVPVPTQRGDVVIDRESVADAAGNLTDDDIIATFEPKIATTGSDAAIRVVGPVFLPDPSAAIRLRTPVRPLLR